MAEEREQTRYVVLVRDNPKQNWELCTICYDREIAWRSAHMTEEQEHGVLKHPKFAAIVTTEADFDKGNIKKINPPAGFDFSGRKKGEQNDADKGRTCS